MKVLAIQLLVFALSSCGATGTGTSQVGPRNDGSATVTELRGAPSKVELRSVSIELTTSLWVNVGPTMPPRRGAPAINGIVTATASSGTLAGSGIRIDHVWLINDERVWELANPEEQDATDPSFADANGVPRNRPDSPVFRIALRNGPAWDKSGPVDVVVRLTDAAGRSVYLRASAQSVGRVQ